MVRLENLSYNYPNSTTPALSEIDLAVERGEYVFLAGASGSGKSTLLFTLMGLAPHHLGGALTGAAKVAGQNVAETPVERLMEEEGLVFQNTDAMLFNHSAEKEVAFGLRSMGLAEEEVEARTAWALELAGLAGREGYPPFRLSGGEKKMLSIAAVLAMGPKILLLDEPFAHLDHENSFRVKGLLRGLKKEGYTIIVAENKSWLIAEDAERTVYIDRGRVKRDGPTVELFREEDLSGLEPPAITRLFTGLGIPDPPLTAEEGVKRVGALKDMIADVSLPRLPEPGPDLAEAHDLRVSLGKREILKGVSLAVGEGECLGVVGPNGSGKTTLLRALAGLISPGVGSVNISGRQMNRLPVEQRAGFMGVSFQSPGLMFFNPTVASEARAGGNLDAQELSGLLQRVNLTGFEERSPFTLSEGEKRRLAVACALAKRARLLLLDEPTAGLGPASRRLLKDIFLRLLDEGGAVIAVSHDLEFLEEVSSRWLVLVDGRVRGQGGPDEVMGDEELMKEARLRPTQLHLVRRALGGGGS